MVEKTLILKASFAVILLLTIIMLSVAEIQVVSAANTYAITASADTHSTINPSGNVSVSNGSSQSFTFSANTGYAITSVLVDGSSANKSSPYTFSNIQTNHTISVSALIQTYYINASADSNSVINPSGSTAVNYGSSLNYTYSANVGYVITSVLVDGSPVSITGNYLFTNVQANHTVAIKASITNFTITSSSDGHSTINPSGAVKVSYGSAQTYMYSANSGYSVAIVSVDGNPVSIAGNYTFTNIQANHTISVSSLSPTPTPTPTPSPTPSPSPTPKPTDTPTPEPTSTPTTSPTPSPTPAPTPEPTAAPTPQPTQAQATTTQTTNPTPQPTRTSTPTASPSPKPTPTPKTAPTETPTPTAAFDPNKISQNEAYPAGIAAASIIGATLLATLAIKKRQHTDELNENAEDNYI